MNVIEAKNKTNGKTEIIFHFDNPLEAKQLLFAGIVHSQTQAYIQAEQGAMSPAGSTARATAVMISSGYVELNERLGEAQTKVLRIIEGVNG